MKKLIAVALLDCRRLGFGLVSAALVGGLLPSLANGLGAPVPAATILLAMFVLVGASCGGYFGNDFADGRSSFFFARPLPTWALIGGRLAALLALAGAAFLAFMASNWLSTTEASTWTAAILEKRHVYALMVSWAVSLFVSLGIAARARDSRGRSGFREIVVIPLRLGLSLTAFLVMFGLFADLIVRAYFNWSVRPIELFLWSWAIASLVASFVAIAAGRTERLRIARFQNLVMGAHFVLVSLVVFAAWSYVLHPDAAAIEQVGFGTWGSPDGRTAFVTTSVNRVGGKTFQPVFVLDIASGQARRLNADPYQGPWTSVDGATMVWSEATPFFFRPLRRFLGGPTTFRVRDRSGDITPLPMPSKVPDFRSARDLSRFGGVVSWVLPAPDGDVFAILWDRRLSFTSRTRGELSEVDFGAARPGLFRTGLFMPSGALRAAIHRRDASGTLNLDFVDIDPKSGVTMDVLSVKADTLSRVQFDTSGSRALLTSGTQAGRGATLTLIHLDGRPKADQGTVLVERVLFPDGLFLADGRIAASSGAVVGVWDKGAITVFSPDGRLVLTIPGSTGVPQRLGNEMFPGVLAASVLGRTASTSLIDLATGKVLRELPRLQQFRNFFSSALPVGASARLLQSADGKLYELPAIDAEPRLLLPLPKR